MTKDYTKIPKPQYSKSKKRPQKSELTKEQLQEMIDLIDKNQEMKKEQSFDEQLVNKLENLFPKGKSQERGSALVLNAFAIVLHKQELKEIVGRLEKITIGYYDLDKIEYENSNDALWEVKKSLDKIKEEYGL